MKLPQNYHAHDATRLVWPTDWDAVFGRSAPLFLEIGFGNADFLITLAQQNPDANVLGMEISLPSIKRAERKSKNRGAAHVRLVHGDAKLALWGGVPAGALARVYINFPDPWHKAAHHHRKLINGRFLALLASRTAVNAELNIATDDPGYQEHIAACLAETPYFESRTAAPHLLHDPDRQPTKYELKARREGRTCHYYQWRRNATAVADPYAIPQEQEMPHVILHTPLSLPQLQAQHRETLYKTELPIRFIRAYYAPADDTLLMETHVVEEPLPQRVALFIQKRENADEYILGLHELGFPRPTYGVHRAIAQLARWVQHHSPETRILHHNLSGGL